MSSQDEQLNRQHDEYIQEVTESGLPLWMSDLYGHACDIPQGIVNDADIEVTDLPKERGITIIPPQPEYIIGVDHYLEDGAISVMKRLKDGTIMNIGLGGTGALGLTQAIASYPDATICVNDLPGIVDHKTDPFWHDALVDKLKKPYLFQSSRLHDFEDYHVDKKDLPNAHKHASTCAKNRKKRKKRKKSNRKK